tara:strand:+ start:62 stop:532 length:471 start_codon:yes stop_codon:yes gene_type:complete
VSLKLLCEEFGINDYVINKDGSIDVFSDVTINRFGIEYLPIKFRNVYGHFNCYSNNLTTLENSPRFVKGDFVCSWNKLTNLSGGPIEVTGDFYCHYNKLTSIKNGPTKLKGNFFTNKLEIKDLEYDNYGFIPSIRNYDNLVMERHRKKIINKILKK